MTILAVMAVGAHALSFSAPALAEQDRLSRENERRVLADPPTAASDGLPVPALAGAVVLAFAVGIAGGQVRQRRRAAHRRSVASARPAPMPTPPVRPAPPPPEPEVQAPQPREINLAAPAAPVPPPPEVEAAPPEGEFAPPAVPLAPPEIEIAPVPPPPEVRTETREFAPPAPAAPVPPPPEPPAAPRAEPQPEEPLRQLARAQAQARPHADAPLTDAPEVPRVEPVASAPPPEPAVPLETAPEALRPPVEEPAPVPARRFARPVPWPREAEALWTCEIAWKAGYMKSSFRAMAGPPGPGKRRPLGDSPSVRWTLMGEPEPPTPELAIRVRALVGALEAAGWQHIGRGRVWYAQRFVWRGSGEPQPVEVPDVAEPAER